MRRRHWVAGMLAGGAAGAWAQPAAGLRRVGILGNIQSPDLMAGPQPRSQFVSALIQGLRDLGLVYGQHYVTEVRSTEGRPERLAPLALELSRLPLDVIVASGPSVPALQQVVKQTPIVMTGSADPVGQGFVQSLARPGGNITGMSNQSVDTTAKRLEILGEVARLNTGPVAVMWDRYSLLNWQEAVTAARERGWRLLSLELREAAQIDAALREATANRASGLLVFNSALMDRQAARIAALATQARLPAMYGFRLYAEAGGLLAYGPDLVDNWRRSASHVDKILKGANPAELPVEQPVKFELLVNLQAARAIGLVVPRSLLLRADEVIG